MLVDYGADPNGCGGIGSRGVMPLHHLGYAGYNDKRGVKEAVESKKDMVRVSKASPRR